MVELELHIRRIIEGLASTHGKDFYHSIALQLSEAIQADFTSIGRIDPIHKVSKTIVFIAKGQVVDNIEYPLSGTPCNDVCKGNFCIYPRDVFELYPEDKWFDEAGVKGYIGAPLRDSRGDIIAVISAMFTREIENVDLVVSLFKLFSGRISAEIERNEREMELELLNKSLEKKVFDRTQELENSLAQLKASHERIIEQEKMASLGNMVAGVAHEINTPLGVAILGNSTLAEKAKSLREKTVNSALTRTDLDKLTNEMVESASAVETNLSRAAELVSSFKQVAVERNSQDVVEFAFNSWLAKQLTSLAPLLHKSNIEVLQDFGETEFTVRAEPAKVSQVILNLINNAAMHAFPLEQENKCIVISISQVEESLQIVIKDNGRGIDESELDKIFIPFYTTAKNAGGTGLGLNIVQTIVAGELNGNISVSSKADSGTAFTIRLPILA